MQGAGGGALALGQPASPISTAQLGGERGKYMVVGGRMHIPTKWEAPQFPHFCVDETDVVRTANSNWFRNDKCMEPKASNRRFETQSSPQSTEKPNDHISRIHFLPLVE